MLRTIYASDKCIDFAVAAVVAFQHFCAQANSSTAGDFVEYQASNLTAAPRQFESSTEVEDELEKWRRVLEENGLKINRKKTEYLRPRNCQDEIFLLGERLPVVDSFKYLGSTLQAEGGCDK